MCAWFGVLVEENLLVDNCCVGRRGGSAVWDLLGSNCGVLSSGWDWCVGILVCVYHRLTFRNMLA